MSSTFSPSIFLMLPDKDSGKGTDVMKNTARHIFRSRKMDMSDPALKALEAKVLSCSRAKVRKMYNSPGVADVYNITDHQPWERLATSV